MPHFSIEELLCLSVGVEPDRFDRKTLLDLERVDPSQRWAAIDFLLRRYEQLQRQFDPRARHWSVTPKDFLAWAGQMRFEVHQAFDDGLKELHGDGSPPETLAEARSKPDKREIDMIAQLFTAMAIDNLGYRPTDQRSKVPGEIVEIAAGIGFSITDDTVRKYLKIGARFLPEDWDAE